MVFGDQFTMNSGGYDSEMINSRTAASDYPVMSKFLAGELEGKLYIYHTHTRACVL